MSETWQKLGFDSPREYIRDRLYDEVELDREVKTCGSCSAFDRCPFPGCESVGWCIRWGEWSHEDDERCDDE